MLHFVGNDALNQADALTLEIGALMGEFGGWNRRNERVGVDLTVGMRKRDPDFDAAIFERVDILHLVQTAQRTIPLGPHLENQLEVPKRKAAQRG